MARKLKKAFSPADWVPLDAVFQGLKPLYGSDKLAQIEIEQTLRAKPSPVRSMMRRFDRDGNETQQEEGRLALWREVTLHPYPPGGFAAGKPTELTVRNIRPYKPYARGPLDKFSYYHFFLSRADVIKRWPGAIDKPHQPSPESDLPHKDDLPQLRKRPGPKPQHDWDLRAAVKFGALKLADEDSSEVVKRLLESFRADFDWEPDASDMRRLVKRLQRF